VTALWSGLINLSFPHVAWSLFGSTLQKPVTFLYTNNKQTETKIRETIPFTIALKKIKCLGINLTKETKDLLNENYKPLKRELKKDIRRWKDLPYS
jgi:hypothetical protein